MEPVIMINNSTTTLEEIENISVWIQQQTGIENVKDDASKYGVCNFLKDCQKTIDISTFIPTIKKNVSTLQMDLINNECALNFTCVKHTRILGDKRILIVTWKEGSNDNQLLQMAQLLRDNGRSVYYLSWKYQHGNPSPNQQITVPFTIKNTHTRLLIIM